MISIKRDPRINGMKDRDFNATARYFPQCPEIYFPSTSLFHSILLPRSPNSYSVEITYEIANYSRQFLIWT